MLATTRAPRASNPGSSDSIHASTPGPWSPTLLSIPPGTSTSRGGALPGQGSGASDFTTTAPISPRSKKAPSSAPCPAVPDAVITGLGRLTDPTLAPRSGPPPREEITGGGVAGLLRGTPAGCAPRGRGGPSRLSRRPRPRAPGRGGGRATGAPWAPPLCGAPPPDGPAPRGR